MIAITGLHLSSPAHSTEETITSGSEINDVAYRYTSSSTAILNHFTHGTDQPPMSTQILICDDSALARKQMARALPAGLADDRSEERRVGKEGRSRWSPCQSSNK